MVNPSTPAIYSGARPYRAVYARMVWTRTHVSVQRMAFYTPSAVSYAPSVAKRRGFAEPPRCITPAGVVGRDGDRRGAPVASRCCISRRRDGHLARMR